MKGEFAVPTGRSVVLVWDAGPCRDITRSLGEHLTLVDSQECSRARKRKRDEHCQAGRRRKQVKRNHTQRSSNLREVESLCNDYTGKKSNRRNNGRGYDGKQVGEGSKSVSIVKELRKQIGKLEAKKL